MKKEHLLDIIILLDYNLLKGKKNLTKSEARLFFETYFTRKELEDNIIYLLNQKK
jgi:hypothetical protein